jgi:hypothetical protein
VWPSRARRHDGRLGSRRRAAREAGQAPRRVVEHFTYFDLATIDQKQAADAAAYIRAAYIRAHANDAKPMFMTGD